MSLTQQSEGNLELLNWNWCQEFTVKLPTTQQASLGSPLQSLFSLFLPVMIFKVPLNNAKCLLIIVCCAGPVLWGAHLPGLHSSLSMGTLHHTLALSFLWSKHVFLCLSFIFSLSLSASLSLPVSLSLSLSLPVSLSLSLSLPESLSLSASVSLSLSLCLPGSLSLSLSLLACMTRSSGCSIWNGWLDSPDR